MIRLKLNIICLSILFPAICCALSTDIENRQILLNKDCQACERIFLFNNLKGAVGKSIWKGLNDAPYTPPLLYFTDSTTYIYSANDSIFNTSEIISINCENGLKLQKLKKRFDNILFHMENKMSFKDSTSIFYYKPMMLCSDVETMHQIVPDFESTEEWLQLVMHEYFHSFQFSHKNTIDYVADAIRISADTLDKIYLSNTSFQQEIEQENSLLLKAIETGNKDSINWLVNEFIKLRINRRSKFESISEFNLTKAENFWETIEGTARYVEYYMALHFSDISIDSLEKCDNLFYGFADYSDPNSLEAGKEFKTRTEIMPAYYYATGFNLCRLLDKLGCEYKRELFNLPDTGLYQIILNAAR